jgi:hypothetical protein
MVTSGNILYDVKDHFIKWDKMFHLINTMHMHNHMRPNVTVLDHMLSCRNI